MNETSIKISRNKIVEKLIIILYFLLLYSFFIATTSTISTLKNVPLIGKFIGVVDTLTLLCEYFTEQNSITQQPTSSTITAATERSGMLYLFH